MVDFAEKFVAGRASEMMAAAKNLDIGVADAREAHAHQRPAGVRQRLLNQAQAAPANKGRAVARPGSPEGGG